MKKVALVIAEKQFRDEEYQVPAIFCSTLVLMSSLFRHPRTQPSENSV